MKAHLHSDHITGQAGCWQSASARPGKAIESVYLSGISLGRASRVFALVLAVVATAGCSGIPGASKRVIRQQGFQRSTIDSSFFNHLILSNSGSSGDRLHVYIDGDGTPWVQGRYPARDPTPRNPLVLRLMAQDPKAAVYVARPCYFSMGPATHCNTDLWTSSRYSEAVVSSMTSVIQAIVQQRNRSGVVLFGYSGGAVIAALVAQRLESVTMLVSVAGNLDTDLWTQSLGLEPLSGSLNPAVLVAERPDLRQLHFSGAADRRVPTEITASYVNSHGGELVVFPATDHTCCWEAHWPHILELVDTAMREAD